MSRLLVVCFLNSSGASSHVVSKLGREAIDGL